MVEEGELDDYLEPTQKTQRAGKVPQSCAENEQHEQPTLGDLNIIDGGFAGGGTTSLGRKRYSWSVLTLERRLILKVPVSKASLVDIVPYEDDPIVLSIVLMGRSVLQVLIDQGTSTNVMFWDTFVGLQIQMSSHRDFIES